jgi:hypothetical protein
MISAAAAYIAQSDGKSFRKRWVGHAVMFTLSQHVPMLVGAHYYTILVSDGEGAGR